MLCRYIIMEQKKLIRFISGISHPDEQKEVLEWIESSGENRKTFARLKNINVAVDILAQEKERVVSKPERFRFKTILRYGARVAAIIILGVSVFYFGREREKSKWIQSAAEQITEVKVPFGESVTLVLPDGSSVKLNSGSVLKFSKLFGSENRELELDGEGYFDVRKSKQIFKVITSDVNIEVLGTKFNISAYNTDRLVTASLFEGRIKLFNSAIKETVILNPDDSYVFDKVSKRSAMRGFNKSHSWTNNYFVADSDDIEVFVKKIERKYNVKIIVAPELIGKCRYTGVFKGETLNEILDNMVMASPVKYKIENDTTVVITQADS